MSVLDLARPDLRTLVGYSSARMEASGGSILLNANESPWAQCGQLSLNRYPDPQPERLRAQLAELYEVNSDQLLIGRGSDELIDLLVRAFCRAGRDAILVQPPTFGMYAVCAAVQGAQVRRVPLSAEKGFACDVDKVLAEVDASAKDTPVKLVFVCAPNNPTGNTSASSEILSLAQALSGKALLVVDEAYIEFADSESLATQVSNHENLVLLRTLSKAHALAAARIGCAIAAPEIIALLRRIMPPYPLPSPCVSAAEIALSSVALRQTVQRIALICSERIRLRARLQSIDSVREVLPSQANFLAVRFADPDARYHQLLMRGIVVRDLSRYEGLHDALRISIGTPEENDAVVQALMQPVEVAA